MGTLSWSGWGTSRLAGGPFEHYEVAIGIAEGDDRAPSDVAASKADAITLPYLEVLAHLDGSQLTCGVLANLM